jgi:hypothetical protein
MPTFTPYDNPVYTVPFPAEEPQSFPLSNDSAPPNNHGSQRPAAPRLDTTPPAPPRLASDDEHSQTSSPSEPHSPISFETLFSPHVAVLPQSHPSVTFYASGMTPMMGSSANTFAPPAVIGEPGIAAGVSTTSQYHQHFQPPQPPQPCGNYGAGAWPRNNQPHREEVALSYPFYYGQYSVAPDGNNPYSYSEFAFPRY